MLQTIAKRSEFAQIRYLVGSLAVSLLASLPLSGQSVDQPTCRIAGTITKAGQPVFNATVVATRVDSSVAQTVQALAQTRSNKDGKFDLEFSQTPNTVNPINVRTDVTVMVVARGSAISWKTLQSLKETLRHDFRLNDEKPLSGRIIDNEGLPVVGARVELISIQPIGQADGMNQPNSGVDSPSPESIFLRFQNDDLRKLLRVETNAEGRFQLSGVGTGQSANILIQAPGIADAVQVITSTQRDSFVHVAQPSRPVAGIVRDAKTGDPIAGATVRHVGAQYRGSVVSDSEGRFRIDQLPAVGTSVLAVEPPPDQPYFRGQSNVPDQDGFGEIQMDLTLQRGTWIDGQVIDVGTGQATSADLYYIPKQNNPFVTDPVSLLPSIQMGAGNNDSEGRFRIVGLPGPGIVAIRTRRMYPPADEVINMDDQQRMIFAFVGIPNVSSFREIDPPKFDESVFVDFGVAQGRSLRIRVVDPEGKSIQPLVVHRWRSAADWNQVINEHEFLAPSLLPNESRRLIVHHIERRLGNTIQAGSEMSQPLVAVLQPTSRLTGIIHNPSGDAVPTSKVRCLVETDGEFRDAVDPVETDDEGRFTFDSLVPGSSYRIEAAVPDGSRTMRVDGVELANSILIHAAELVDLGTLVVGTDVRPKPKRSPINAQGNIVSGGKSVPRFISGRIVDQSQQPISGARLELRRWASMPDDSDLIYKTLKTDQNGLFQLNVTAELATQLNQSQDTTGLVVSARRYGSISLAIDQMSRPGGLQFEMRRENVIRGTVRFENGEPARNAKLTIDAPILGLSADQATKVLERLKSGGSLSETLQDLRSDQQIAPNSGALAALWETNENGRFSIRNVAKNSILEIKISIDDRTVGSAKIINRPLPAFEILAGTGGGQPTVLHGSRPTIVIKANHRDE